MLRPELSLARWRPALAVAIAFAPLSGHAVTAADEGWEHLPASAGTHPAAGARPGAAADPAKPKTLDLPATHINRCPGVGGRVILQDAPCTPLPDAAASAAAVTTADVVELSALSPRPVVSEPVRAIAEPATPSTRLDGALNGAWKLGLLIAACYGVVRLALAVRDRLRSRRARAASRDSIRGQYNSP